ncbi:MAG: argininosuccinate lyase [Limisphaerales bacterium]|nr:MAG: argininosuccinate lyase [Limisphaerales bacterium]KAG0508624.1 MAG: argininosuccinate lyase [Limisphaerales bacterium]TXT48065.1 MAG: argininosuccinate lyase [Limisphaerales bacterium]
MSQKSPAPVSRSGRFASGPGEDVARFTESISFDWRLWWHDLHGSLAHAAMLQRIGVLTRAELKAIQGGLRQIAAEIEAGKFKWKAELEDVHMNLEAELTRRVPAGAKLHTGRSRNDQIALDVRMWLRDEIIEFARELRDLQRALVELGAANAAVIIPGYTHVQRAQPVYFAHHLLAYVEMLDRDYGRLLDCFNRVNVCPLGSGAIAGSTLPLDREFVAKELGFVDAKGTPQVTQNSMDAVSDRDFAIEFCSLAALVAMHLSRLSEDVILWASSEFNFIKIADAYTTGSSLMPQKKNPDIAELTRGKTGRVYGNLVALLTLLKGLPMTYNRDLQEDKERLFDTADTVRACVRLMAAMLRHTTVNAAACAAAASDSALLATDLADYLVRKGMPFRHAHHAVGAAVALAEKLGKPLGELTAAELKSVNAAFGTDAKECFNLAKAMARRNLTGAPGTKEVAKQLARWQKALR